MNNNQYDPGMEFRGYPLREVCEKIAQGDDELLKYFVHFIKHRDNYRLESMKIVCNDCHEAIHRAGIT